MKRIAILIAAVASIASAAFAQGFSFLKPPTLAVMDFEVSMSEIKDYSKEHYGQLISQALMTALVRQNALEQVVLPVDMQLPPGSPVYADTVKDKRAATQAMTERKYMSPIFKIFDKKYVEMALQGNAYTSKDLYAQNANAYAFAQLDFLVLGNVYQTASLVDGSPALGFNVRVLNTRRAEELYSYIAIVDAELTELPFACARIAQALMRDILNNHCAQFKISESPELKDKIAQAGKNPYDYLLFWQPKQVQGEDGTVGDSVDAHKRLVEKDKFYWALPGQYVLSVYNRTEQQLKTVPFSLNAGEIKHVSFDESQLKVQNVSVTVSGVLPADSYTFEFKSQAQQERYRWEIDQPMRKPADFRINFSDGKASVVGGQSDVKVEYRPATGELVINEVSPAEYQVKATSNPPSGAGSVNGWWVVSSQLSMTSQPLPVDLRGKREASIGIADFKLQAKKAVVSPKLNKVTFLLEPGFACSHSQLVIDDKVNWSILWWSAKEKVTVSSEYSQADWDMYPTVSYNFDITYLSPSTKKTESVTIQRSFKKSELEPGKDVIVVLDLEKERADREAEAASAAQAKTGAPAALKPAAAIATPTSASPASAAQAKTSVGSTPAATVVAKAAASGPAVKTPTLQLGIGGGSGNLTYYTAAGTYPYEYGVENSISGSNLAVNAAILFPVSMSAQIGFGLDLNIVTLDETEVSDAGLSEYGMTNVAATLNLAFGAASSPAKILLDVGFGTGFAAGFGIAFKQPGSALGFFAKFGIATGGLSDLDIEIWDEYSYEYDTYKSGGTTFGVLVGLLLG